MREKEFLPLVESRLGIDTLNDMQRKMMEICGTVNDIILLSPTGSGKTLAFVLPMLKLLRPSTGRIQAVVIAPGRELVVQIYSIIREIAAGFKVTAVYGGHKVEDEVNSLATVPDIVVATPGRLLDHAVRGNIDLTPVRILVLDEFDKSLELGFAGEMEKILKRMKNVSHTYLTSATDIPVLPEFLRLDSPARLDYTPQATVRRRMRIHRVDSDLADKLESLLQLICSLANPDGTIDRTIVFVNHRESAQRVFRWLKKRHLPVGIYHGALDQTDREKAVAMFNNGTTPILIATDLAARGLDIELVKNIIHYHQPLSADTYTHRNGRTARVDTSGDVFVIVGPKEDVAEFIEFDDTRHPSDADCSRLHTDTATIYFGAGKKEKLSRGDILGYLGKVCGIPGDKVGKILVADRYSLAAVPAESVAEVTAHARDTKIKGKKIRIAEARPADPD